MNNSGLLLILTMLLGLAGCGESNSTAEKKPIKETREKTASVAPSAQAAPAAAKVSIDATAARNAGIAISTAGPASLKETLSLYGVVQANAERTRTVIARFPGVVKSVHKTLGDAVQAGAVLATIESNDSLQTYAIKAPLAGTITARNVNTGESVAEHVLFTITDLATVWVDLSLFARDMAQVKVGQEVAVRAADGGPTSTGKVVWLSALGSATTQSRSARVLLDNSKGLWTPGLYVTGELTLSERPVALAVQSSALQTLDGKTVVFSANNTTYEARPVKVGTSDGTLTEILEGLQPNTPYVSANSFLI
ncbi:MAG TPA: efflux RND transporter periplasmic adaptor subunit, partial [Spongiibacteraceae bacterium]|nr:efflux RND transporter periplasmic adaptor subunit [Spongiibacteraceae bacterium]